MKKTLTLSLVSAVFLLAFASCNKDYDCRCNIKYVVKGQVVGEDNTRNTVTVTSKKQAQSQCVYYETEESYLQQKTNVQHYCAIAED